MEELGSFSDVPASVNRRASVSKTPVESRLLRLCQTERDMKTTDIPSASTLFPSVSYRFESTAKTRPNVENLSRSVSRCYP